MERGTAIDDVQGAGAILYCAADLARGTTNACAAYPQAVPPAN
ncbi:hypothetical protein [Sphingomonas sp. Root710]|nr:hypothetical protein [Sphingomonas sp. Root710]